MRRLALCALCWSGAWLLVALLEDVLMALLDTEVAERFGKWAGW